MANHKFDLRHKETVHRITRRSKCWNPLKKSELRKDQIVRTLSFAGKFDRDPFYPIPAGQKKRGPGPVKHHRNPVFPVFFVLGQRVDQPLSGLAHLFDIQTAQDAGATDQVVSVYDQMDRHYCGFNRPSSRSRSSSL